MNKHTLFKSSTGTIVLSLLLLSATQTVFAEDTTEPAPANPYSSTKTVVLEDGTSIDIVIANSPATPPEGGMSARSFAGTPAYKTGDVIISGVPAFDWSYGASATAGAMIAGYYDRNFYPKMYEGPTNGGETPLINDGSFAGWESNECPLSATKNGVDGRATFGHVDDYYVAEGNSGPDPYDGNWTAHTSDDCTADFMKTSIWFKDSSSEPIFSENINKDGAAVFVLSSDGYPKTASDLEGAGYDQYDAGYGLKLFYQSRLYTVTTMYNQYINPVKDAGFTYEQYQAEIDAGRPVMLHLSGHIVVGTGYNDLSDNEVIFHDSWSHDEHTMIWGGTYNTVFVHNAVTIVYLEGASKLTWYKDADGDGYSDGTSTTAHIRPTNYFLASELKATSGDCNDSNAALNPATIWYQDADGDGYGNPSVTTNQCEQPADYVSNNTDCDDTDEDITTCFNWIMFFPAIIGDK